LTRRNKDTVLGHLLALNQAMQTMARRLALLGGVVLLGLIGLTCVSIMGRQLAGILNGTTMQQVAPDWAQALLALGSGPVLGDYEVVELGMAIAIFCFLPYCHLTFGHARVDLFLSRSTGTPARLLRAGTEALFTGALAVIAWRLTVGLVGRFDSGQTSYLLNVPLWQPYLAAVAAAWVSVAASATVLLLRWAEVLTQREILHDRPEDRP